MSIGILVVDDNPMVRTLLGQVLGRAGFCARLCESGAEAVEVYRQHQDQIDVVLSDVQMPGLDGPQTLAALRQVNASVRCCFMSADTGDYTAEQLRALGAVAFVPKPFPDLGELARTLRELASSPPRQRSA